MNEIEEQRLLRLLLSVEKEDSRAEERVENPGAVKRQLFLDERIVEHIDQLESDDDDVDSLEVQEDDSESDQSGNEEETPVFVGGPEYTGRDKITKWNIHCPPRTRRTADYNLVRRLPGIRRELDIESPAASWKLFFSDEILENIVKYTNQRIDKVRPNYTRERDARCTTSTEICAFIGLLYMGGLLRASHLNLYDLWLTDGTGVPFFSTCMNLRRFKFLIRTIRFDDATTRQQRKQHDKLAPIRELFEQLVEKCKVNFSVSEYLTVDEMLESFRGRCPFKQYIKNKPAKYGIKIFSLTCAKTFYTMNMEVYAGKQPEGPYKVDNSGLAIVSRLVQPVSGTRRNITTDNWYTSIPLADSLLQNHQLTLVGTLRKNKKEIPPEFINTKSRPVTSSMFAFRDSKTLLSYCPKKNKIVLLLSTMHSTDEIDPESEEANKPYILTFYNSTKGGVDVADEYKARYSVSRTSNRWPLTLFFSLLNIIGLNSFIVYKHKAGQFDLVRRKYLKELAQELCRGHLMDRHHQQNLPRQLKRSIHDMLGLEEERRQPTEHVEGPGRCGLCGWRKHRKTKSKCQKCNSFICKEHTVSYCVTCSNENTISESEDD